MSLLSKIFYLQSNDEETYYLKNNDAMFVANCFSEKDGKTQGHLLMVGLNDPDEVMWKLVSKRAVENQFGDNGTEDESEI